MGFLSKLLDPIGIWDKAFGGSGKKEGPTVEKRFPQGTANFYDDSYKPLLESMGGPMAEGAGGSLQKILSSFKGSPKHLQDFLQIAAPFIAGGMQNTQAFQDLQNYRQFSDVTQGYGAGAGRIGQAGRQAMTGAGNTLARSGLGRSSALAGIGADISQRVGSDQANLWTQLYQNQLQNRAAMASNALDAHRMITTLALGHNPAPRMKEPKPDYVGQAIGGVAQGAAMIPFL